MKELAFLNSGIKITLTNDINSKTYEYYYEGGIEEYINEVLSGKKEIHENLITIQPTDLNGNSIELSLKWTNSYTEQILMLHEQHISERWRNSSKWF